MANGWKMYLVDTYHRDVPQEGKIINDPDYIPHIGERVNMGYSPHPTVNAVTYSYEEKVICVSLS